jgi:tetratricopeptide (TPR) repeat protein
MTPRLWIWALALMLLAAGCAARGGAVFEGAPTAAAPVKTARDRELDSALNAAYELLKDNPRTALSVYENIAVVEPGRWEAHYNAGLLHMRLDDMKTAEKMLAAALKNRGDASVVNGALAALYLETGRADEAEDLLKDALKAGKTANAMINMAYMYQRRGKAEDALKYYMEAEKLDPVNPVLHYNAGLILYAKGEYDKALARFDKAIGYGKTDPKTLMSKAQALVRLRRYEDALKVFEEIREKEPANPLPYRSMGIIYEVYFGDSAKAFESYSSYVDRDGTARDVASWLEVVRAKTARDGGKK